MYFFIYTIFTSFLNSSIIKILNSKFVFSIIIFVSNRFSKFGFEIEVYKFSLKIVEITNIFSNSTSINNNAFRNIIRFIYYRVQYCNLQNKTLGTNQVC